jgi:hypothetical protein
VRNTGRIASIWAIGFLIACGSAAAITAGDLSKYRSFQFGADLEAIARQTGSSGARAKVIHGHPAVIQELQSRPQPLGPSTEPEAASEVIFRFLDGGRGRIEVMYDRYEIEGLTSDDIVAAVSAHYVAATHPATATPRPNIYGALDAVVGRWEDPQYRFDLVHSSSPDGFDLIGVVKKLDSVAIAGFQEARRLDDLEARNKLPIAVPASRPQRRSPKRSEPRTRRDFGHDRLV